MRSKIVCFPQRDNTLKLYALKTIFLPPTVDPKHQLSIQNTNCRPKTPTVDPTHRLSTQNTNCRLQAPTVDPKHRLSIQNTNCRPKTPTVGFKHQLSTHWQSNYSFLPFEQIIQNEQNMIQQMWNKQVFCVDSWCFGSTVGVLGQQFVFLNKSRLLNA